ncbi:MAG: Rpn family recombination-promoting nuclease/putative transposase [Kiritimatiellae bacterium]|nr:Rpn family recombination-promoting nuclease/putative transposase [Kiritimatiellia bacterium]
MVKYLDPKADLTFKRVFGEHPNLVASLLNSLLPLPDEQEITDVEYMSPELLPRTSLEKNSIVDVFCKTGDGRRFIVEMQMCWTAAFKNRVLFNSAKVYVDQLERGDEYSELRPVYSLNLVDAVMEKDVPEFIHHYKVVHEKYTNKVIKGLHIVFVELPKFKPQSIAERKMAVLWLRFLTEINNATDSVPPELMESKEISQAVELVKTAAYSQAQLMGYDLFWDAVRVQKEIMAEPERRSKIAFKKGLEEGLAEGRAKGLEEGLAEGKAEGRAEGLREGKEKLLQAARNLKAMGLTAEQIAAATGLTAAELEKL